MKQCELRSRRSAAVLGLFPFSEVQEVGGIQNSGRIAWEGIAAARGKRARLFSCAAGEHSRKIEAVLRALREPGNVEKVLVWHLGLLKLLPFLRLRHASVALFLHGIEVWKKHGWVARKLLNRVDLFLCNSAHTWARFTSLNPEFAAGPHAVTHLGTDSPIERPIPVPDEPPAMLMISRLMRSEDYKGHREMIDAWPRVLRQHPEAKLWIAGDGDLRPDLETLAKERGLSNYVRFFGQVDGPKKESLLAHCRALALPSRGEGFGLVYLEAMRQGRPCLVGTEDAGREVVNPPEAGLAADPSDADALAEAACSLLSDGSAWKEMSLRARKRYEQRFTAAHFQERLLKALE